MHDPSFLFHCYSDPYKPQYQAAEETARSAKKHMWVQGDTYESPRAYRKRVGIS
jgi:endonuclease YncB( thermonuclease family)